MLPVTTNETVTLSVPTRPVKPVYRESENGKQHLDATWFVTPTAALLLLMELITFNVGDLYTGSGMTLFANLMLAPLIVFLFMPKVVKRSIELSTEGYKTFVAWRGIRALGTTIEHPWSELECIRYQSAAGASIESVMFSGRGDSLVLDWRGESPWYRPTRTFPTTINLWYLTETQKIQLFTSIAQNVPQELLAPEVLYLQLKTLSGESAVGWDDYTNVWLDEYNRKFEMPNYIALQPGTSCGDGRFKIGMTIAGRVNSSTYIATAHDGGRFVIKELVVPVGSDDQAHKKMLEQFNREANTLAKLAHPAIVRVVDHFIENNRSYIVMDHVSGKNLREYVRLQGVVPESEALKMALQMAEVLQYLHHHAPPILHRDFTPDNLICDREGKVTVIDFGAANVFDAGKTATLIGKQKYMPPEQLRGKPSPASDIYSFAATVCFILTGEEMISMGNPPLEKLKSTCKTALYELLCQCTSLEESNRPAIDDVISQLRAMQNV